MPFWEKLTRKKVPQGVGPEGLASNSQACRVESSLQTFGLRLLQQECAAKKQQNVFISPLSIFLALAMTENGAAGETKAAMRGALALPPDASEEAVSRYAAGLMRLVQSQGEAELAIANALWADVRAQIAPDFVRRCQEIYGADAETLDLNEPSSATAINRWVSEKTKGKIPAIVTADSIAGAIAILTNAVYFRGKFQIPFRKEATAPKPFYLADGREKVVPLMRKGSLSNSYRSGTEFEAAILRYKDSGIELYMLLPARGTKPEEILREKSMQEMLVGDASITLDLSMPRFTIDFTSSLKNSLTRLGMGPAFQNPGADFSALGSRLFFLNEVIQKTRLEMDEEGTVAVAATAMDMALCARHPRLNLTRRLVFDRPFAILLRDRITNAILFAGVIYEP